MGDIFKNNLDIENMVYNEDEHFYYITYNLKNGEKHDVILNKNLNKNSLNDIISNFEVWKVWPIQEINMGVLESYLQVRSDEEIKVNKCFSENQDKVEKIISDININANHYYNLSEAIRFAKYCKENNINVNNSLNAISENIGEYEKNLRIFEKNLEFQFQYIAKLTAAYNKFIIKNNYLENIFEKTNTLPNYNCFLNGNNEMVENIKNMVDRMDPNNAFHIILNDVKLLDYNDLLKYEARKNNITLSKVFNDSIYKNEEFTNANIESKVIEEKEETLVDSTIKEVKEEKQEIVENENKEIINKKTTELKKETLEDVIFEFASKIGLSTEFLNQKQNIVDITTKTTEKIEENTEDKDINGNQDKIEIEKQVELEQPEKENYDIKVEVKEARGNTNEDISKLSTDTEDKNIYNNISFSGIKAIDSDELEEKELKHEEKMSDIKEVSNTSNEKDMNYKPSNPYQNEFDRILNRETNTDKIDENYVNISNEVKEEENISISPASQTRYYKEEFDKILNQNDNDIKNENQDKSTGYYANEFDKILKRQSTNSKDKEDQKKTTYYADEFEKILNRQNTNSEDKVDQKKTTYYADEFEKILNRQNTNSKDKENQEIENLIKAKNDLINYKYTRYVPYDYSDNYYKNQKQR